MRFGHDFEKGFKTSACQDMLSLDRVELLNSQVEWFKTII
jgi:hypothetical protein